MSIILSKIYSRERPLFDFFFWDEADRLGIKTYLNEDLKTDIRIVPPRGKSGEVWYSEDEIEHLSNVTVEKIRVEHGFTDRIMVDAKDSWLHIEPYVKSGRKLETVPEMLEYYRQLVVFWAAFNTVFFELPNRSDIDEHFRSELLRLREATQEYTETMSLRFVEYLQQFHPELGEFAYHVSPYDVQIYLERAEEIVDTVRAREEKGCFIIGGRILLLEEFDKELAHRDFVLEKVASEVSEVQGTVAYAGKTTGRAKIVFTMQDLPNIATGDVLITPMTIPDYVPYLKIAGAFVTDEGGVTSHAAIVARELKKPCVIGTKFATQVFKDGDMVEVDANNGIVRRI